MIKTGGRTDVLIQWFSNSFVRENPDLFKKVLVNPGEVMMVVKDGAPQQLFTESNEKLLPGFLGKIKELFTGQPDLQIFFVDLKPKSLTLPISGYSKDRTQIKGVASIVYRPSKDNILRLFNLLTRDLVTDTKWGKDMGKIKEVCEEDILNIFAYDSSIIVDSTVISKYDSSEFFDNRVRMAKEVKDSLNTLIPNWANCGFDVDFSNIEITENAYEEVARYRDMKAKEEIVKDIDFQSTVGDMDRVGNLELLMIKKAGDIDVEKAVSAARVKKAVLAGELELELQKVDSKIEIDKKQMLAKLDSAKSAAEIAEIEGRSKFDMDKMAADSRNYSELLQIDREARRQDLRIGEKNADTDNVVKILDAKSTNAIDKAYNDGYSDGEADGKKMAAEHEYQRGYTTGFTEGQKMAMEMYKTMSNDRVNAYGDNRGRDDRYRDDRYRDDRDRYRDDRDRDRDDRDRDRDDRDRDRRD